MSVAEFKRGVPTYKDKDNNEFGLLCETKEVCVTDNEGVSLEYKLQTLLQNINNIISGTQKVGTSQSADSANVANNANSLGGYSADTFAKVTDLSNYLSSNGGTVNGVTNIRGVTGSVFQLTATGDNNVWAQFFGISGLLGHIGMQGINNPIFVSAEGIPSKLLHTGNSSKVVISQTAPSDTSALWVW